VLTINLGCGPAAAPGWLNCDLRALPGVDLQMDLRRGLPLAAASADGIAGIHGDPAYFYVPDCDARNPGAKLVTQIVWYGSVRTPFTFGFLEEWLAAAGFADIRRCAFGESRSPGLAHLDNRGRESLFVEAARQDARGRLAAS
jgi:hypothetical protein